MAQGLARSNLGMAVHAFWPQNRKGPLGTSQWTGPWGPGKPNSTAMGRNAMGGSGQNFVQRAYGVQVPICREYGQSRGFPQKVPLYPLWITGACCGGGRFRRGCLG